jgi:hypothetical protein
MNQIPVQGIDVQEPWQDQIGGNSIAQRDWQQPSCRKDELEATLFHVLAVSAAVERQSSKREKQFIPA